MAVGYCGVYSCYSIKSLISVMECVFKHKRFVNVWFKIKHMSNFQPFEVVNHGSETLPHVVENSN